MSDLLQKTSPKEWKEIRPIFAGIYPRASYPVDEALFMTFQFEFREEIDADCLSDAWNQTVKAYPYVTYAVQKRGDRYVFTEDPLPFVIKESDAVIEPFGEEGNFHSVTFCYKGNKLNIYADHVPYDGTGFKTVMETLFYHYYCKLDGREYPVPDGLYTGSQGALPGQEEDAFSSVPPLQREKPFGADEALVITEGEKEAVPFSKDCCRTFLVSIPSDEMISYARSVGGSPMSVLAVFMAKTMQQVHPENQLPVCPALPVSVRKAMGNPNSLLYQVVHAQASFDPKELLEADETELNRQFRSFLKDFTSKESIQRYCGYYRTVIENSMEGLKNGTLDNMIRERQKRSRGMVLTSYLGTLRTGDYGSRIRMTVFHVMPVRGITVQMTEVGKCFYADWYQGFSDQSYLKTFTDILRAHNMSGAVFEAV